MSTAVLSSGELVVVAGDEVSPTDYERTILRADDAVTHMRLRHVIGERVVAGDARWWYSVAGNYGGRWGAVFTQDGDNVTFVNLPLSGQAVWVPIGGATPRGIYVSGQDELSIMDVGMQGVRHRWTISERPSVYPWLWTAHELSDGSLAVVSADGPDRTAGQMVLRILDSTSTKTTILGVHGPFARIASAIDAAGNLAIVSLSTAGRIEGAVIDPHKPVAKWIALADGVDETRVPAVVSMDDDFAAVWLTRDGELVARSFTRESAAALAAIVAKPGEASFFAHEHAGELLFMWQAGDLRQRLLPAELSGYQALAYARELVCKARRP